MRILQSWGDLHEVFGGRLSWLVRGHSSLCTDPRATGTYRTLDSQPLRTSMLASTHILVFMLDRAPVFCPFQPTNTCPSSLPACIFPLCHILCFTSESPLQFLLQLAYLEFHHPTSYNTPIYSGVTDAALENSYNTRKWHLGKQRIWQHLRPKDSGIAKQLPRSKLLGPNRH